jgi:hypothetical protein
MNHRLFHFHYYIGILNFRKKKMPALPPSGTGKKNPFRFILKVVLFKKSVGIGPMRPPKDDLEPT